jgi:hypothetical protein
VELPLPKRNYKFEKRQKDLDKQRKREEKRQRKLERKTTGGDELVSPPGETLAPAVPDPVPADPA